MPYPENDDLWQQIRNDPYIQPYQPHATYHVDLRNNEVILYSPSRALRPHDKSQAESRFQKDCPICQGQTTTIWDKASLSHGGFTFINENLYPAIFPGAKSPNLTDPNQAWGIHLVGWTSNFHNEDYHNMCQEDIAIGLERLALLEEYLLTQQQYLPIREKRAGKSLRGFVSVIKNFGRAAGGSLSHGHIQIIHGNIEPPKIRQDREFKRQNAMGYSRYLQQQAPHCCIKKYAQGVSLYTPFCLKRPLEAVILLENKEVNYLFELTKSELLGLAQALRELTSASLELMKKHFWSPAYNLLFHMGEDIGGLYIELIPFTKHGGGFEQLGMHFCSWTAQQSTQAYQQMIRSQNTIQNGQK